MNLSRLKKRILWKLRVRLLGKDRSLKWLLKKVIRKGAVASVDNVSLLLKIDFDKSEQLLKEIANEETYIIFMG